METPGENQLGTGPGSAKAPLEMRQLLELAVCRKASDLHLTVQMPPILRIDGELVQTEFPPLTREEARRLIYGVLSERQRAQFEQDQELDVSVDVPKLGRFRMNIHSQRGNVEAAFRLVPPRVFTLRELGLPPLVDHLARKRQGLVLITGPAGMGKTTTLAGMVDLINTERSALIITIEDPIEYVHQNKRAVIKQREVYSDTRSFAVALVRALRQDPNVIVVGEIRDLATISTALTAAETGHLVLATLHTLDTIQAVSRIVDVFPAEQQQQVSIQLADCLQGVVSQQLLPRADGQGLVVACEVLIANDAVRYTIRSHTTDQIKTIMQTGAQYGMRTMDDSIRELYLKQTISYDVAVSHSRQTIDLPVPPGSSPRV